MTLPEIVFQLKKISGFQFFESCALKDANKKKEECIQLLSEIGDWMEKKVNDHLDMDAFLKEFKLMQSSINYIKSLSKILYRQLSEELDELRVLLNNFYLSFKNIEIGSASVHLIVNMIHQTKKLAIDKINLIKSNIKKSKSPNYNQAYFEVKTRPIKLWIESKLHWANRDMIEN